MSKRGLWSSRLMTWTLAALAAGAWVSVLAQDPATDTPTDEAMAVDAGEAAAAVGEEETAAPTELTADDPVTQMAEMMPRAARSLILDIAESSDRAVAVGERGHILISESRRDWRQVANVPTRSTLTAVAAVGNMVWAVGHEGVIVHSQDGGQTWVRQRVAPFDKNSIDLTNGAPLLDVLFLDEKRGYAIGAYSLMLVTTDGGQTWTQQNVLGKTDDEILTQQSEDNSTVNEENWTFNQDDLALDEESDPHLNSIARTGDGSFFMVAERGAAFRSTDDAQTWGRIQLPYDGSMFGVLGFEGQHILCFGLRGNVYESFDLGTTWTKIETGTTLSLMGGDSFDEGGAVLVGANGIVLSRVNGSEPFRTSTHPDGNVLASVVSISAAEFAVAGETGLSVFSN
jgi:photosystem II stability/assembly factor-like uncharacterized protein